MYSPSYSYGAYPPATYSTSFPSSFPPHGAAYDLLAEGPIRSYDYAPDNWSAERWGTVRLPDTYDQHRREDFRHDLRRDEQSFYSRPKLPKLYVSKISTNCMGPWLLLKEAGIPFELVEVDLAKGDNHTNEFLAMNPMGQVPTYVETDGTVIWESNAIMRFICEKHTVPRHFYPRDVNLRGRIEMALDWRQTVLYPNVTKVCYPALGFTKDRSRVAEGRDCLDKDLRVLSDFFLRETPYIGGALPCIADYAIGLPLLNLYATDFRIPPKVREYLENLASKSPAWNEVTEDLKRFISRL